VAQQPPRPKATPPAPKRLPPGVIRPRFASDGRPIIDYDLPEPRPIVSAIKGSDALDTAARKVAAAEILFRLPEFLTSTTGSDVMPPKLAQRHQEYLQVLLAERKAIEGSFAPCTGDDCPRRRYFNATWGYEFDPDFLAEVLATVPPDVRSRYMAYKARIANPTPKASPPSAPTAAAGDPPESSGGESDGWGVGTWTFAILATLGFLAFLGRRYGEPEGPPLTTNYGTASFADPPTDLLRPQAFQKGVFLGKGAMHDVTSKPEAPFAPVFTTPERHTLIVAPTRTGKGTRVIIPTLLRYGGSMLTIDPKGENAAITATTRQRHLGHKVHIVNPWNLLRPDFEQRGFPTPATYNPLDVLDRNDPAVVSNAQALAATICPPPKGDRDGFWMSSADELLTAILLWITDQPDEQKTLARARDIIGQSRRDMREKFLVRMAASTAFDGTIRQHAAPFLDLADETYSGVISNLSVATRFLSDPLIKAATASSTFSMKDLVNGKTTIYLVIPPDRMHTQRTWLRLVITSAMQTLRRYGSKAQRCMFLIDEFAALGRIDEFPKDISNMSGYGLDVTLIVQGLDQLKDTYGDAQGTIISNCGWKWFSNIDDYPTAKYISDSLGKKTIRTKTKGQTKGKTDNARGGGSSSGESTTWSETARDLLTPDEVLALGRDAAIAFESGSRPHFLQPIDYWSLEKAFAHLKKKHPGLYWVPPLQPDPNPYMEDETRQQQRKSHSHSDEQKRQQSGGGGGRGNARMTPDEAREILGVGPNATPDEIRAAYKRLMSKLHPDKGGSNRFAQMLNEARKTLLGE